MGGGPEDPVVEVSSDEDWQQVTGLEAMKEGSPIMKLDEPVGKEASFMELDSSDVLEKDEEMKDDDWELCFAGNGLYDTPANKVGDAHPSERHLFNLITIKSDKQELSFVEKILLSKEDILELFNRLKPGSIKIANSEAGRWLLDLSLLGTESLQIVGFYGSKSTMTEIFTRDGILPQAELEKVRSHSLAPGLYCCLCKEKLVIFYWQPSERFSDARRSDASCNFIRYLVELCSIVYCCIDVKDGSIPMTSVASTGMKKKRTQRLQISLVKSSENDFKVRDGFRKVVKGAQQGAFKLSDGFHRSALLLADKYTPKECFRPHIWNGSAQELENLVKGWGDVSLDFSNLGPQEFTVFALSAGLDGIDKIIVNLNSLEQEIKAKVAGLDNPEERIKEKKCEVLQVFAKGLTAYLRLIRPWEEDLYSLRASARTDLAAVTGFTEFLEYSEVGATSFEDAAIEAVESAIIEVTAGTGSTEVLFVGSRIELATGETYIIKSSGGCCYGPVFYNEPIVVTNPAKEKSTLRLLRASEKSGKEGPVMLHDSFVVLVDGLRSGGRRSFISVERSDESHLKSWLEASAREASVPKLKDRAYFANWLIREKAALDLMGWDDDALIQCALADVLDELPPEHAEAIEIKKRDISRQGSGSVDVCDQVALACIECYKAGRFKFMRRLFDFFKVRIIDSLKSTIKTEMQKKREELGKSLEKQRLQLVENYRLSFSKDDPALLKVIIDKCEQQRKDSLWRNIKSIVWGDKVENLFVKFRKQEVPNERVIWKVIEFIPMKKDIDLQTTTAEHLIVPQSSEVGPVVDMDVASGKLVKVCYLKSGQALLFVEYAESELALYFCQSLGARLKIPGANPIRILKRGTDLVAFEEVSKFVAFYHKFNSTIKIYRFDDSFREMSWTGIDFALSDYHGSRIISWMQFIPGKAELLVLDDKFCVKVLEVTHPAMMRPGIIQLPTSVMKVCTSADGLCLISICGVETEGSGKRLSAEVYRLDDTLEHIKTVDLNLVLAGKEDMEAGVVTFGSQMHLLIYDRGGVIQSLVLNVTVASQCCQLQLRNAVNTIESVNEMTAPVCHELDYLYHIFDKYSISPPLLPQSSRTLEIHLFLKVVNGDKTKVGNSLIQHAQTCLEKLQREKGKDFSKLKILFSARLLEEEADIQSRECNMAAFLRQLMTLVPVQIARAENNTLKPLIDGLEMPPDVNYGDSISLAGIMKFGLYDAVIESWGGPVKVISSMGKQSSGKSYLLNHLSGSLLDVAGGRCTDGVWMTASMGEKYLYIILDFEGLGSFERSEQEDMLLSIMNAAVSNITIFNKKDFHLDKETEAVFERFQNGVSLVKQDVKLFKGLFYMAIKDVDAADVDDLKDEFYSKILQICNKSQDNFLTKMYGGEVEIAAMPPFNRAEFHESICQVAQTVEELDSIHTNGKSFLRDLKLVIAQISSKDWSPIDTKRIAFKVNMLKKHLNFASALGSLGGDNKVLINFDTEEEIEDHPLIVDGHSFDIEDTGLRLARFQEMDGMGMVLGDLVAHFEKVVPRTGAGGKHDEDWHISLENFLESLAERRKQRVLSWTNVNTNEFSSEGDVQKLILEASAMLAGLKESLAICGCKCEQCFLKCVLQKSHPSMHSCNGNHLCSNVCTYCQEEGDNSVNPCSDVGGHEGPHDCKMKSHTCGAPCGLLNQSSNCNKTCALKIGHMEEHRCNSRQHMCKAKCSLPSCNNTCVTPVELSDHGRHCCHEKMCPIQCTMQGCNRKCATDDHFHSMNPGVTDHFCGNEHQCFDKCESHGNCEVLTEVTKKTKVFWGKRSNFEYEHVSEQNGIRKPCCVPIPPFLKNHKGPHRHTTNMLAVHFCEVRCEGCGYFCNLPIGHPGLHDTTHGNMTQKTFVAESEDVDILDRKYAWGESGAAEMCMMHCKARGRGHIHLAICKGSSGGVCAKVNIPDGARHETKKYGPDFDVPKDELTHAAFWKNMRFRDPCSDEDQKQFALCACACRSADHISQAGAAGNLQQQGISYCIEKLWHDPVSKRAALVGTGYVTEDGHHFACNHSRDVANHVIFIIDSSGSMGSGDIRPQLVKFHSNRLGCVYEAMVRFIKTRMAAALDDIMSVILFNGGSTVALERVAMEENQLDSLMSYRPDGCTTYSAGLQKAEQILINSLQDNAAKNKAPAIIFLSDGGNNGALDPVYCVNSLKSVEPRLVLHTIMFGTDPYQKILMDMAKAGGGVFQVSLDELQLARSFEGLAKSLVPKVASLI